jgi:hypothetical protein
MNYNYNYKVYLKDRGYIEMCYCIMYYLTPYLAVDFDLRNYFLSSEW